MQKGAVHKGAFHKGIMRKAKKTDSIYLLYRDDGSLADNIGNVPPTAQAKRSEGRAANTQVIGILPAQLVSSFIRDCPPKQRKYLGKTLPFLLEDSIASPIETMHCVSQSIGDNQIRALAVSRDVMSRAVAEAEAAGVKLDKLYVDADLIAIDDGGKTKIIRCSNAVKPTEGQLHTGPLKAQLLKTGQGLIAGSIESINQPGESIQINDMDNPAPIDFESREEFCINALADDNGTASLRPPINLLQREFEPHNAAASRAQTIQKIMFVITTILFIQVSYWLIIGDSYKHRAEELQKQSRQTYQHFFPDDKKIIDIVSQAQGHLSQTVTRRSDGTFLLMLATLGESIKNINQGEEMLLTSVKYEKNFGQLTAELRAKQISHLENLRNELKNKTHFVIQIDHISQNPETGEKFPASMQVTLKSGTNNTSRGFLK